ncbi:unnamed protein product [Boreogadus saida]
MELQVLLESYDEEKDMITRKGNAKASATRRTKAWQRIADRLAVSQIRGATTPVPHSAHKLLLITLMAGGAAALTTWTGESIPVQNGRPQTQGGGLAASAMHKSYRVQDMSQGTGSVWESSNPQRPIRF